MSRVVVLGVPITPMALADVVDQMRLWIARGDRRYFCFVNAHVIETARVGNDVRISLEAADLALPDGAPVAWAARRASGRPCERVSGGDLFRAVCEFSGRDRWRHAFVGGTHETLERLTTALHARHPAVEIVASISPPFRTMTTEDDQDVWSRLNAARPDVVWVGLGAPKQELWMWRSRHALDAPVLVGIGAVFDFESGNRRRAPRLLQRLWLEWAFRLIQEPSRLWKRYLWTNSVFIARATSALLRGRW